MFKTKLTAERLRDYLMSLFLILSCICLICVMIGFFRMFFPYVNATEWDLLAFIGSVIAAVVTVMGIRVPILSQRREQIKLKYESILKQLILASKSTRMILGAPNYKFYDDNGDIDLSLTLEFQAKYIHDYIEEVSKFRVNLIESMDLVRFEHMEAELRSFARFQFLYENLDVYIKVEKISDLFVLSIREYLDRAIALENFFIEYQNEILQKYKQLIDEPSRGLFKL
ncbi:hypothetical protein DET54_106236 [Paenibacillus pabuli]|uniref:Phage abortive infection protein n=1 Tax=Paenibacillus pabuli TaxID=1472 RepID=A0ABX9BK90_9BACL|nr:hypothetical protein [Paenibacillus pabuli]RAI96878.1 hypothetical protein DET54_106236 [Paenibacillus pabuli]